MVKSFGDRLKYHRLHQGLTQLELAEKCGWPRSNRITQYELGARVPRLEDIKLLANVLEVPASFLAGFNEGSDNLEKAAPRSKTNFPTLQKLLEESSELENQKDFKKRKPNRRDNRVPLLEPEQLVWQIQTNKIVTSPKELIPSYSCTSDKAFALEVRGDHMLSPNMYQLSFPEGSCVIAEPKVKFYDGAYVIALIDNTNILFRRL